jgi:hypothetical protein
MVDEEIGMRAKQEPSMRQLRRLLGDANDWQREFGKPPYGVEVLGRS